MTGNDRIQGASPDDTLAGQRLRLASLEACEERMRTLREQECDLEVEHMAAAAALQAATKRLQPDIDGSLAARIGRVLEHRRELAERGGGLNPDSGLRSTAGTRQKDQLRAGVAALQAWLDASQPAAPGKVGRAAKITLLLATIVSVWAAISIHPAFLLLLLVVVGPVSFAMGRGQDSQWHRAGAKRRFEGAGLAAIATWDDASVKARMAELQSILDSAQRDSAPVDADSIAPSHPGADQTVEDDGRLASLLEAAGLNMGDTTGDTGEWLRLVARAEGARESLELVKSERARLRGEAHALRDHLQRYLHSRGVKPTQQSDTAAAIAAQLDKLE